MGLHQCPVQMQATSLQTQQQIADPTSQQLKIHSKFILQAWEHHLIWFHLDSAHEHQQSNFLGSSTENKQEGQMDSPPQQLKLPPKKTMGATHTTCYENLTTTFLN